MLALSAAGSKDGGVERMRMEALGQGMAGQGMAGQDPELLVETCRGGVETLIWSQTSVQPLAPLETVLGRCLCAISTSQTSIVALYRC